jgi:hypothetical protein
MISRLDLKLVFRASSEILASLLNVKGNGKTVFWTKDGALLEGLGEIHITSDWHHNKLIFGVLESMFDEDSVMQVNAENVTVKNAVITPMPNYLMDVALTAQVREPDEHQLKKISDFQKKEGGLEIVFDDSIAKQAKEDEEQAEIEE